MIKRFFKDVIYAMKKLRNGYNVEKQVDVEKQLTKNWTIRTSRDEYITTKVEEVPYMIFTFYLPSYISKEDVSHISIENNFSTYSFSLSQSEEYLQNHEIAAIENYEHQKWNFAKDDNKSGNDKRRMAHYWEALPECYTDQLQTFSRSDLIGIGATKIAAFVTDGHGFSDTIQPIKNSAEETTKETKQTESDEDENTNTQENLYKFREASDKVPVSSHKLLTNTIRVDISTHIPVLSFEEITKMEETFRHLHQHHQILSGRVELFE